MLALTSLTLLAMSDPACADRPDVDVEAPDYVKAGENVPVVIEVEHDGSAPGHYVDLVRLYDGDTLLKEWRYGPGDYVKEKEWTLSYTGTFDRDARLKATARCILHGSGMFTEDLRVS